MSPEFRKVALIAAALGLLVSLFFALRPDDDGGAPRETTTAETETQPPPTPAPPADATVTIRIAVAADAAPTVRKLSVRLGRKVEIVVRSELTDSVHLHGYDVAAEVAPGKPGRIAFTADAPGRFELELEERGLPIAELEVRP